MVGSQGWKKRIAIAFFLLPNLIGFMIFVGIPMISSLILSFSEWDLLTSPEFIGFDNYIALIHDKSFWNALKNTLSFIMGYLPSVIILALIAALLLNQRIKARAFFRATYFVPVITSWVAVALIWKWLFNPSFGLINYFLSWFGIAGPAWLQSSFWAMPAIIVASVWKDIGFVMVIFLAGLQGIPGIYYEAAEIDGASPFRKFWHVTLPLLAPTTFFVIVISLINSFQVFDQVMIMTQGGPAGATTVLVQKIYTHAFEYFEMGYGSAISWVLFILIFGITLLQMKLQKRWVEYED